MAFTLNYDNMLFLDAEDLAEAGIKKAYDSLARDPGGYTGGHTEVHLIAVHGPWEASRKQNLCGLACHSHIDRRVHHLNRTGREDRSWFQARASGAEACRI